MHVLITGATGFVGIHVLHDALIDTRISKITVVARRPPSLDSKEMTHDKSVIIKKMNIIIRDDMENWDYDNDPELVAALLDCKACIWCIGGKADDFATPQEFERISYTFTVNAASFLSRIAQQQPLEGKSGRAAQPFRFCYCSAKWADRNGKAGDGWFSWETQSRNMKGRVEDSLLSIGSKSEGRMSVFIFRPGGMVAGATVRSLGGFAAKMATTGIRMMPSVIIHVERVARVLVDASVGIRVEWRQGEGEEKKDTWESEEMVSWSVGLGV